MRLSIFLLFLILLFEGYGQNNLIYEGEYSVEPGINGLASFEYVKSREGSKIKNGIFSFNYSDSNSMAGSIFEEMSWQGRYQEDQKHGQWWYRHLTHNLQVLKIKDFKPDYRLDSHKELIRGVYDQGQPHGPWSMRIELISNYRESTLIGRAEATFKRAKLDNNLYFEEDEDGVKVSGKARNGIMVDIWQFNYISEGKPVTEVRNYREGFLKSLVKMKENGDTIVHLSYPLSKEIRTYLDSGQNENVLNAPVSLHFSDGYPRNSAFITEQDQGNHYLQKLMEYLVRHDAGLADKYGLPLGANRMYYPLSSAEQTLEENWVQVYYDYRNKVSRLQELSRQNGVFDLEDTIALIDHWIGNQRKLMEYISPWDNIIMKKEMGYYNREGMLKEYVENVLSADTLTYNDLNKTITYHAYPGEENSFLFFLDHNIKQRTLLADSFLTIYERKHRINRDLAQVLAERREILNTKGVIQKSLENKTDDKQVDAVLEYLNKNILQTLVKEFVISSDDSALSINELKLNGEIMRERLALIKETEHFLRKVAQKKVLLEEIYTAYRFDPFTYSENVPYKEYPEVYAVFAENMVDDLLASTKTDSSIQSIYSNVYLAMRIQDRLVFLSDKEEILRRIEKKLNKRQSKEEKLALLKP